MTDQDVESARATATPAWSLAVVAASAVLGLALIADQSTRMSATYDEVTYLKVAARWWRLGDQDEITRLGSPLTFWKLQQAPTLWTLDRLGLGAWIDDPIAHQSELLPAVRVGESWIWLAALLVTANWARRLYGAPSMAMAAALFALSPNLLAHGALSTMELPLLASSTAMLMSFWSYLRTARRLDLVASAALGGLAFSCKFTAILIPPILGCLWVVDLWLDPESSPGTRRLARIVGQVAIKMTLFVAAMLVVNVVVTGFAATSMSPRRGEHPSLDRLANPTLRRLAVELLEAPVPSDWAAFATQSRFQKAGGMSYLLGERRMTGWTYYYLVALAVKVPLAFWALAVARGGLRLPRRPLDRGWFLPAFVVAFLLLAMLGSKRNYGVRYLLPMAPPAIVWVSGLAGGGRRARWIAGVGLVGMAYSVAMIHPHELSYFNEVAGGPIGGRHILADSNLDWGQGARSLARLQRNRPEFRDLTLFYFGDTDPAHYGVEGRRVIFDAISTPEGLPARLSINTPYLAVSASLQWGPWGPDGYFRSLDDKLPLAYTDDFTIAIYRADELRELESQH